MLPNFTTSLLVNFYQINSIQWFYERRISTDDIYAIKTNTLWEYELSFVKKDVQRSGYFQQNVNKVNFILKSEYIET